MTHINYVKHKKSDSTYGILTQDGFFIQHKWNSLNKPIKEGVPRGDIGQLAHVNKGVVNPDDFQTISNIQYEDLFYKDYSKIN